MNFYWDMVNAKVTTDSNYTPILCGMDLYVETYSLHSTPQNNLTGDERISIAYSEEIKKHCNMYDFRNQICEDNGLKYSDLGALIRLTIPKEKYDALMKEWQVEE